MLTIYRDVNGIRYMPYKYMPFHGTVKNVNDQPILLDLQFKYKLKPAKQEQKWENT